MAIMNGIKVKTSFGEYVVNGLKDYDKIMPHHFEVKNGPKVPSPDEWYAYIGFLSDLRFAQDIPEYEIKEGYPFQWRRGDPT